MIVQVVAPITPTPTPARRAAAAETTICPAGPADVDRGAVGRGPTDAADQARETGASPHPPATARPDKLMGPRCARPQRALRARENLRGTAPHAVSKGDVAKTFRRGGAARVRPAVEHFCRGISQRGRGTRPRRPHETHERVVENWYVSGRQRREQPLFQVGPPLQVKRRRLDPRLVDTCHFPGNYSVVT